MSRIVAFLLLAALCGGCDRDPVATPQGAALVEVRTTELSGIPEPSGLALDRDGNHLWTVSDQTGSIYRLTLGGSLQATLDVDGNDLEGLAVDPLDGSLYVVEEGLGRVSHFDREGNLLGRVVPAGLPEMGNSGLEGIVINPANGHFFLLKEKNPGLLVEMTSSGEVLVVHELDFAADYSGLAFDSQKQQLLILSDQSANLSWCSLDGRQLTSLRTNVEKGEGIALAPDLDLIYIVSDSRATLGSYRNQPESSAE